MSTVFIACIVKRCTSAQKPCMVARWVRSMGVSWWVSGLLGASDGAWAGWLHQQHQPPTTSISVWSDARQHKNLSRWVCGLSSEKKSSCPGVNHMYYTNVHKNKPQMKKKKHSQLHRVHFFPQFWRRVVCPRPFIMQVFFRLINGSFWLKAKKPWYCVTQNGASSQILLNSSSTRRPWSFRSSEWTSLEVANRGSNLIYHVITWYLMGFIRITIIQ